MYYLNPTPNPSGAYPAPQSNPAPGLLELTEEQATTLIEYNGFVSIGQGADGLAVTPNTEAWEAWKASLPPETEPEPTEAEQLRADVDYLAVMTGVAL